MDWIVRVSGLKNKVTDISLLNGSMSDRLYQNIHKKVNSRKHLKVFSWDELFLINETIAKKIWDLAKKYGYKYDWNYNSYNDTIKYNHKYGNPREFIKCSGNLK